MKRFLFLSSLIFLLFSLTPVLAADLNVVCDDSSCSVFGADPLFSLSQDGPWYPGRYLAKTINVGNSSPNSQVMSLKAARSPFSIVASLLEDNNIINLSLLNSSSALVWAGDLSDFYSAGEIDFGVFSPGTGADYTLKVSMNTAADNTYQDKDAKFDLTLGFTTDTTPTDNPGDNPSPPGPPGPSLCTDAVPATPTALTATLISSTQVRLNWTAVSPPFTSYLVAFGPALGDYRWGNPNVGSGTSYVVGSLTPGAQYCFYVRAQNGCMPGLASDPVCVNVGSAIPIVETIPPGFEPGVLGEQTENSATSGVDLGDIEGEQTACSRYWLPLLYLLVLFINLVYYYYRIEKKPKSKTFLLHLLPFFLSVLSYVADKLLLKNACCLIFPVYCSYFWIGSLLSWFLPFFYFRRLSK